MTSTFALFYLIPFTSTFHSQVILEESKASKAETSVSWAIYIDIYKTTSEQCNFTQGNLPASVLLDMSVWSDTGDEIRS